MLRNLYNPLHQSLEKRIAASAKVLANLRTMGYDAQQVGTADAKENKDGEESEHNKAITLLPTSEKFSRALESIHSKFLRDKRVQESGAAVVSRVFAKFQQEVMVPDSYCLVEAPQRPPME